MDTKVQDADQELRNRYHRAANQLEPWKVAIDAIADANRRDQAALHYAKIEKLATYVAGRLSELKFARDNGLDYLCRDAAKKVDEFEREILKLRAGHTESQAPGQISSATTERPTTIQEMRAASHASASLAPPPSPTTPGRTSVVREMKANAATGPVQVSKTPFAEVVVEVEQWNGIMEDLSGQIHHFERNLPEGISPVEGRRRIADLQTKHRRTMERLGRCKGWVRTGSIRLAATDDWQRDFEIAREDIANLARLVAESLTAALSQMPPPPVPSNKPEIKTVPIGRSSQTRSRPGVGLASSEEEI